ncbi:hypothetical protein O2W20_22205 [Modestobacter sp. VKM Ac-2982]|nr:MULTISPECIES: hypothetical protein [unclassified Modestobacter]MCZ2826936.1 hypothetical protein [Modestobacter sp. VKM Ac-2981]MCZ2855368.1 hypothetical protein [Modestobacter sp. VKM Ac-2982]
MGKVVGSDAADRDDPAARGHRRGAEPQQVDGPPDVDVDHPVDLVVAQVGDGLDGAAAGVAHDDVQATAALQDRVDELSHLCPVAAVRGDRARTATRGPDVGDESVSVGCG